MGIVPVEDEPKMVGRGRALARLGTGLTCPMVGVLGVELAELAEGRKILLLAVVTAEIKGKLGRVG